MATYGFRTFDLLGEIGTESSAVTGLCLFADTIPYTPFPHTSVVIQDVENRSRLALQYYNFNGMWFTAFPVYDSVAKTLTITNNFAAQPDGSFFLVMQW